MSLNNINLNNHMVADLYPSSLVQTSASSTHATPVPEAKSLKFLGKNNRNIVLVVEEPELPFLKDEGLAFLTNILSACKLSLADVAIVNISGFEPAMAAASLSQLSPSSLIMFGLTPPRIDMPIDFAPFQLQKFGNTTYLHAPGLDILEKDKSLKMQLWNALKNLFGI